MSDIRRTNPPKVVELIPPQRTPDEERYYKALDDLNALSARMTLDDVIDLCFALQRILADGKNIGRRCSQ